MKARDILQRITLLLSTCLCSYSSLVDADTLTSGLHLAHSISSSAHAAAESSLSNWAKVRQTATGAADNSGVDFIEDIARNVLLMNGSADDSFFLTFYPEQGFRFPEDYHVVRVVSNENVLNNATDIELMTTALANGAINMTATLDFHEFPGTTNVSLEFRRKNDSTLFDSLKIQYLAAGIGVFRDDPELGQVLLSGTDKKLKIPDYHDNLGGKNHYEFGTLVQFLNGSTSDAILDRKSSVDPASLFNIDTLTTVMMKNSGQIDWDPEVCRLSLGTWDGSSLTLPDGCGMGMALGEGNGTEGGALHFGYDFEEYRAGNLDVLFEWDRFTEGSEFEDVLYENYLKTEIGGDPPAIVRLVSPVGEFATGGKEDLYVEMVNANNASIESFVVNGAEAPFLLRPGTYQQFKAPSGFYESAVFQTAPGTGKHLPWSINATRENGTRNEVTGLPIVYPVTFIDQSGFSFSYDNQQSVLRSVEPSVISDKGGEEIVLFGSFEPFNLSNPDHEITFNNQPINSALVRTFNSTHITLESPPRSDVGTTWQYKVTLQTDIDVSNSVDIFYRAEFVPVRLRMFGGSLDRNGSGSYEYGPCSKITIIRDELSGGETNDFKHEWTVIGPDGLDILKLPEAEEIDLSTNTLSMPVEAIPEFDTIYNATVKTSNNFTSGSSSVDIKKTRGNKIGVHIVPSANRTLSVPESSLRLVAKIDLPNCGGSQDGILNATDNMVYEWGWENKGNTGGSNNPPVYTKYQIRPSDGNLTENGDMGIIRIGREFIIPRTKEQLSLGRHLAYLFVFEAAERESPDELYVPFVNPENNSTTFGYAETKAFILQSDLQALIGNGEERVTTNGESTIEISGVSSFDPDILDNTKTEGISYSWSCEQTWASDLSDAAPCAENLLPAAEINFAKFEVPATALMSEVAKDPRQRDSPLYLKYSLLASKSDSTGALRTGAATQVVEVTQRSELQLLSQQAVARIAVRQAIPASEELRSFNRQSAPLPWKMQKGIKISNGEGKTVDPKHVKFWEDLIIAPIIQPQMELGTTWRFELTRPANQKNVFFSSGKLLSELGFYEGGFGSTASRYPLGIKAGMLSPNQAYTFKIIFGYDKDGIQREGTAEVNIRTVEFPRVVFPPLSLSKGTSDTIFRATARIDVEQDAAYNYQFYLYDIDDPSVDEYCLDGCTGAPVVLFRTFRPGNYSVEVRLIATNGKTVLDVIRNEKNISVTSNTKTPSIREYEGSMTTDFANGDDGGVNQRGFFVSHAMRARIDDGVTQMSGLISLSDDGESAIETCHSVVPSFVKSTLNIAQKEQPTTANLRNYIILASNYARLSCVENEKTLYDLLSIVDISLSRIPAENTVQTESYKGEEARSSMPVADVVQEAQRFYNFTITRAISSQIARGSSRQRLAPVEGEVNNLILDLYEKWQEHVLRVATSGQVCGFSRTISTQVPDGLADPSLLTTDHGARSNPFAHSQLMVAIRCNEEQGLSLEGLYSKFEYCPGVFTPDESGSTRKIVSLAEMYDYVYLSGIQGKNMTDSSRLVSIDLTVLESSNRLVSALSSSDTLSSSNEGRAESIPASCYTIGMQMEASVVEKLQREKKLLEHLSTKSQTGTRSSTVANSESCRFSAFTMWPTKNYEESYTAPFQNNAYMRREDGIAASGDSSNDSYVTVQTPHLGLYGAIRLPCTQSITAFGLDELSGQLKSVLWLIFGILITVIVVTALTYLLATTVFTGKAGEGEAAAEALAYVERDYFGRGGVQLVNRQKDGMSGTETDTTGDGEDISMNLAEIEGLGGAGNR